MRPHDAASKLLFSFPEMVRDLLAGFVPPEWVEALDLSTLERWPESTVSDDLRQRHRDRVWQVRRHERRLCVLVLLEFQSVVDRTMAVRILAYTALLHQDLLRASSDPLPTVLPIVLYHGPEPWTAARDVAGLSASPGEHLAPYQPSQRYFVLDIGGYTGPLPAGRNRMAELIRLARSRGLDETMATFEGVAEWLSEPEHEGFMRALWEWLRRVQVPAHCPGLVLPALVNWRESKTMLNEAVKDWSLPYREQGRAEGRIEGFVEGLAEGRIESFVEGLAEIMRRQATRKFDAATAERLAERMAEIPDRDRALEIGEWIIECEDGDELLRRVEDLCGSSTAEDGPARG